MSKQSGPSSADLTQQLLNHTAREAIGFNLLVANELLNLWRPGEMRRDHLAQHALVSKAIRSQRIAITQAERMDQRQVAWMSRLEKALLQCGKNRFRRNHSSAVATDGDRVAVMHPTRGASGVQKLRPAHVVFTGSEKRACVCLE